MQKEAVHYKDKMNFKINNTRELKSLHLLNKIKKLKYFLGDTQSCGIFITCASLHPIERIETHDKFLASNLKVTKISHKLIKIIFKTSTEDVLQNLLSGPVYLIEDSLHNLISKDKLNSIFAHKKFIFRFLYLNQQLYRAEEIFEILKTKVNPITTTMATLKYKQILLF